MSNPKRKEAIVLLSGGLDSATTFYIANSIGFFPRPITFTYNQRHSFEINTAKKIAATINSGEHLFIEIDSRLFKKTALVGDDLEIPKDRKIDKTIPITYVPARNIIFLSHALALAESLEIFHIFVGVNALDYSEYPDCRPEFIEAFERMATLGMKTGIQGKPVKIHTPLINMTKGEIIKKGLNLGINYALTSSCYEPGPAGKPCRHCDSCRLREKGFAEAGQSDPLL